MMHQQLHNRNHKSVIAQIFRSPSQEMTKFVSIDYSMIWNALSKWSLRMQVTWIPKTESKMITKLITISTLLTQFSEVKSNLN